MNIAKDDDWAAESFQLQALEIQAPGNNFDPQREPQNGEEFLTLMAFERKHCPSVVVRRPKSLISQDVLRKSAATQKQIEISSLELHTNEWKSIQLEDFECVRKKIAFLREELSVENYSTSLEPPLMRSSNIWSKFCRQNKPLMSILLRLDQCTVERLLGYICEWMLGESKEETSQIDVLQKSSDEADVAVAGNTTNVDLISREPWLGSWIYAALACLQVPLRPEIFSLLREIARNCISERNQLEAPNTTKAIPYNLFIYLIAKAFGQLDFCEFV